MSFSDIYTLVHKYPGIDAPLICLWINEADIVDPDTRGSDLAKWLRQWHRAAWDSTCIMIDRLIEDGKIVFMDDGKIYPMGYQGDIDRTDLAHDYDLV